MLIVMKAHATEEQVRSVCEKIESLGLRAHSIPGAQRTAIGITGNEMELDPGTFDEMVGVQEVIRVSKPYKLVSRDVKEEDTVIRFAGTDATFGGDEVAVMAGPCAIETASRRWPLPNVSPAPERSSSAAAPTSRAPRPTRFRVWRKMA